MKIEPLDDRVRNARVSYENAVLDESSVAADPRAQLRAWLGEAYESEGIGEPNAMTLSTARLDGQPSSRVVLLRGQDDRGLLFFTNYESEKGRELAANPLCSLLFYWGPLERQIRIDGRTELLEAEESDGYFKHRPRGHRLSAWASKQSSVVPDRSYLDVQMLQAEQRFGGMEIARPPFWGGYRVLPHRFEFWQGRRNRAHDRIAYRLDGERWIIERLAP
jgi:pyridoxamine 5'-phosphate oxidase